LFFAYLRNGVDINGSEHGGKIIEEHLQEGRMVKERK
jgi:hypothetical protein